MPPANPVDGRRNVRVPWVKTMENPFRTYFSKNGHRYRFLRNTAPWWKSRLDSHFFRSQIFISTLAENCTRGVSGSGSMFFRISEREKIAKSAETSTHLPAERELRLFFNVFFLDFLMFWQNISLWVTFETERDIILFYFSWNLANFCTIYFSVYSYI